MACNPPQTPVTLTLCNTTGIGANVTDAMIGINTGTRQFAAMNIVPFSATVCKAYPEGYISVVNMVIQKAGNYNIPTATGSTPYGSNRDSNGLLTPTMITTIVEKLGICINTRNFEFTQEKIRTCNQNDEKFIRGVQIECGYYYALYKHAIKNLAAAITCPATNPPKPYGANWPDPAVALDKYTQAAIILNQMVNDVIYIMDQVAQTRTNIDIASLTTILKDLDGSLTDTASSLQRQRNALTSPGQEKMVLFKEMETYSRQKAAYHNNLLALYSFLNITAIGLLFYVYRST
jgi:hypothetical protein